MEYEGPEVGAGMVDAHEADVTWVDVGSADYCFEEAEGGLTPIYIPGNVVIYVSGFVVADDPVNSVEVEVSGTHG